MGKLAKHLYCDQAAKRQLRENKEVFIPYTISTPHLFQASIVENFPKNNNNNKNKKKNKKKDKPHLPIKHFDTCNDAFHQSLRKAP